MAAIKTIFCLFAVLVSIALVYSQEDPSSPRPSQSEDHEHGDHEHGDHENGGDNEQQNRFFFSRWTSCNYTAEPGRTCRNCRQALTCLPSGIGNIRTCHGIWRYCNNGRCSIFPGSACIATTTESTSSSTSSSTSTSSTTSEATTAAGRK